MTQHCFTVSYPYVCQFLRLLRLPVHFRAIILVFCAGLSLEYSRTRLVSMLAGLPISSYDQDHELAFALPSVTVTVDDATLT